MGKFVRFCAAVGVCLVVAFWQAAKADVPSVRMITAPMVSPSAAWTFYGASTTHTTTSAAWATPPPEMAALARSLGSGRLTTNEYAENIATYVRNNIRTEFRFGLGKGAREALIEQSGTPFDQAELMVKLLRQGGVTADFQVGTVDLTPAEFGKWSGFVKNLNQGAQTFDVDAAAACKLLADGAIPAIVNGSSDCTMVSGNLSSLTIGHIWVRVTSTGYLYDPSFKQHTLKNGIDLPAAVGCSSGGTSQCGSKVLQAALATATTGAVGSIPYIETLSEEGVTGTLNDYAKQLQSYQQNPANNLINARIDDVVGGSQIDTSYAPTPGTSLPYSSSVQFTWSGDVPNQYRTTLTVQQTIAPDILSQLLYADEIGGRRIRWFNMVTINAMELYLDNALYASAFCGSCYNASTAPAEITFTINHPYAASGGAYGDETTTEYVQYAGLPITVVHGWGNSSPSAVSYYADLQAADPTPLRSSSGWCSGGARAYCREDEQVTLASQLLAQTTQLNGLVEAVSGTAIIRHHTVGAAFSQRTPTGSAPAFTVQVSSSVQSNTDTTSVRPVAFEMSAAGASMLEGSVLQQSLDTWNPRSAPTYFVLSNRQGYRFLDVAAGSMSGILASLTGYDATRKSRLSAASTAGFNMIIPQNGTVGSVSLYPGTPVTDYVNYPGGPDYGFMTSGTTAYSAYLLEEIIKGGSDTSVDNPITTTLQAVQNQAQGLAKATRLGVDLASGGYTLTPPADLVTGSGAFPYSLPFQRTYSSEGGAQEVSEPWYPISTPTTTLTYYSGLDSQFSSRLGGGWTHNYQVGASLGSSGARAMGADNALDASATLAGLLTLRDLMASPSFATRLTWMFVADWLGRQQQHNLVTVRILPGVETFQRLPDGSFNAAGGLTAQLVQNGEPVARTGVTDDQQSLYNYEPVRFLYTSRGGEKIDFDWSKKTFLAGFGEVVTNVFKANTWTFPVGIEVRFSYTYNTGQRLFLLDKVTNSLGRQILLYYGVSPARLTNLLDDSSRAVSFSLSDCPVMLTGLVAQYACNKFNAATPTYTAVYGYVANAASPNPSVIERIPYRLRRWFVPSDTTNAYQVVAFDDYFHVKSVTDKLSRQSLYFSGALLGPERVKRGEFQDAANAVSVSFFNKVGRPTKTIDPLGRTTTFAYDALDRLIQQTLPEGNYTTLAYDVRSNVVLKRLYPKPASPLSFVETSSTFTEGPNVATCSQPASCNRPATTTDAAGNVTDYDWDRVTGLLKSVTGPAPTMGATRPQTSYLYASYGLPAQIQRRVSSTQTEIAAFTYAGNGLLRTSTIDGGLPPHLRGRTTYTFDDGGVGPGNVTAIQGPRTDVNSTSYYTWDTGRRLIYSIQPDPDGAAVRKRTATKRTYNTDGDISQIDTGWTTQPDGSDFSAQQRTTFAYDAVGNRIRSTVLDGLSTPALAITQTKYDAVDRVICTAQRMNPAIYGSLPSDACTLGTTGSFGPDIIASTDYDAAGQVWKENRAVGTGLAQIYATHTYTNNGKLASSTDARSNALAWTYDGFDRLDRTTFADSSYEQNTYDVSSNVTAWRNRAGAVIDRTYDDLNRKLTEVAASPGTWSIPNRSFTYDLLGRLTAAGVPDWSYAWTYDGAGRVQQIDISQPSGSFGSYVFTRDAAGNPLTMTYPNGATATRTFDAMNRVLLTRYTPSGGSISTVATLVYDDLARRSRVTFGDNSAQIYTYDNDNRLSSLDHTFPTSADNVSLAYGYDPASREVSRTTSNAAYRWAPGTGTTTYATANNLNQYPTVGGGSLTYTGTGNLATDPTLTYAYDEFNNLMRATDTATPTTTDTTLKDVAGLTYSRETGSATVDNTLTLFSSSTTEPDFERLYHKAPGAGSWTSDGARVYLAGPGADERLAWVDAAGTIRYPHTDKVGTAIAVSAGGAAAAKFTYSPFGESADPVGTGASAYWYRYTGQRLDPFAGQYDYKARVYSPGLGRFLQTDPAYQQLNLYAYVGNNPLNATDPSGRTFLSGVTVTASRIAGSGNWSYGGLPGSGAWDAGDGPTPLERGTYEWELPAEVLIASSHWTMDNFIRHYWNGNGAPVDLAAAGLEDEYRNSPNVKTVVNSFKQRAIDAGEGSISDSAYVDVTYAHPSLFPVGHSLLNMSASCYNGVGCQFSFSFRDKFQDPMDIRELSGGLVREGMELPFSHKYDIFLNWQENVFYGEQK